MCTCRLKWSDVIKPAIKIAKEGFRVTEHTGEGQGSVVLSFFVPLFFSWIVSFK